MNDNNLEWKSRLEDRKLWRKIFTLDVYMVYNDGRVKTYETAGAAYLAAQQTGGVPLKVSLSSSNLRVIKKRT